MDGLEVNAWLLNSGKNREAIGIFLEEKCIAVGWSETGDLTGLSQRQEFRAKHFSPETSVRTASSVLFRFCRVMEEGDSVVVPDRQGGIVHVGKVESSYVYEEAASSYRHRRKVSWRGEVLMSDLSEKDRAKLVNRQTLSRLAQVDFLRLEIST